LYYLATGIHPFYATDIFDYKQKVLDDQIDYSMFNSERDSLLIEFLQKMIQKDPKERVQVKDLLND
jgi:serine/threonine protein kinase